MMQQSYMICEVIRRWTQIDADGRRWTQMDADGRR